MIKKIVDKECQLEHEEIRKALMKCTDVKEALDVIADFNIAMKENYMESPFFNKIKNLEDGILGEVEIKKGINIEWHYQSYIISEHGQNYCFETEEIYTGKISH